MRWLLLSAALAAWGQDVPKFEGGVSLVRVDVEVTSQGKSVPKLLAQHFRVLDNGEEQKIVHVGQDEESLDVMLLFDTSGSMKEAIERASTGAKKALAALRPGDRVGVMTFAGRPRLLSAFNTDLESTRITVEEGVLSIPFQGATHIWDAVYGASEFHFKYRKAGRRRAVLIITDNYGQRAEQDERTVLNSLWEADVVLAGVIVRNPGEARKSKRPVQIDTLVEETGGATTSSDDPGEGLAEMMERIRKRYSIYYAMPKGGPGERRSVRVELEGTAKQLYPEARVFARKGYYLPGRAQSESR